MVEGLPAKSQVIIATSFKHRTDLEYIPGLSLALTQRTYLRACVCVCDIISATVHHVGLKQQNVKAIMHATHG